MEKIKRHRPRVKWPKATDRKEWEKINNDLIKVLEQQVGTAQKKLERMGDIIYCYGKEHFGVCKGKSKKSVVIPTESRRQQEMKRLIRERRQLKKQMEESL